MDEVSKKIFMESSSASDKTDSSQEVSQMGDKSQNESSLSIVTNKTLKMNSFPPKEPYYKRYYLLYGKSDTPEFINLEETSAFLTSIGYNGGELRKARVGIKESENFKKFTENELTDSSFFCSYCGDNISGADYFVLQGGKRRCTRCSRSIIKDKKQLCDILGRILSNMEQFFMASIPLPDVELVSEKKLRKKLKVADNDGSLIYGVAIEHKSSKRKIIVQNGAPRINVIATFAHELTHIWQYTHWDDIKKILDKMPDFSKFEISTETDNEKANNSKKQKLEKKLVLYEGMAKWAEIQYLYMIGEVSVAEREESITLGRNDEYGVGFKLFCSFYPICREAMKCIDTPFKHPDNPFAC